MDEQTAKPRGPSKPPPIAIAWACSACGAEAIDRNTPTCNCRMTSVVIAIVPLLSMVGMGVVIGLLVWYR